MPFVFFGFSRPQKMSIRQKPDVENLHDYQSSPYIVWWGTKNRKRLSISFKDDWKISFSKYYIVLIPKTSSKIKTCRITVVLERVKCLKCTTGFPAENHHRYNCQNKWSLVKIEFCCPADRKIASFSFFPCVLSNSMCVCVDSYLFRDSFVTVIKNRETRNQLEEVLQP